MSTGGPRTNLDQGRIAANDHGLDRVLAVALTTFAVGNLVLVQSFQEILGVDYLLLVAGALALVMFGRLRMLLATTYVWGVGFVLLISAIPGLVVVAPTAYGDEKAQSFVLMAMAILSPACFRHPRAGARLVLISISVVSVLFSLLFWTSSAVIASGRLSVMDLNPVGVARMTGLFVVTGIAVLIGTRLGRALQLSILAAVVVCAIVTSATGSRGPIVSIIVAVATVVFLTLRSRDVHIKFLIIVMAVLGTAIGLALHLNPSGFSRVLDGGDSGRSGLYSFTLTEAVSNPDGIGWGGFATVAWRWGSDGDRIYPHNVLLELLVEGGVIAFLGFALVFTFAVWRGARSYLQSKDRVECAALGVYVYALANAQFSSDLVGNRMLWVSLGLVLALSNRSISREKTHP